MTTPMRFQGCMPANLLPFTADLQIDEAAYREHLRWLAEMIWQHCYSQAISIQELYEKGQPASKAQKR